MTAPEVETFAQEFNILVLSCKNIQSLLVRNISKHQRLCLSQLVFSGPPQKRNGQHSGADGGDDNQKVIQEFAPWKSSKRGRSPGLHCNDEITRQEGKYSPRNPGK